MKSCLFIFIVINIWSCLFTMKLQAEKSGVKEKNGMNEKKEKNPFSDLSDAELDKMMKQYGLDSKDFGVLSSEAKNEKKTTEKKIGKNNSKDLLMDLNLDDDPLKNLLDGEKKGGKVVKSMNEIYYKNKEILKNFELTNRDAFNLIFMISKFNLFNKLPITAMNIVNEAKNKQSYQKIFKLHKNTTEEMNYLISNTLNSQTFIDQENKVGRKGMLSIVDKDSAEIRSVWAVLNNKVFCFYNSSNYLKIIKIYRISQIKIRDFIYSPCFFIYNNETEFKNTQLLICALNFREKDYWIRTLQHHKEQYLDFNSK